MNLKASKRPKNTQPNRSVNAIAPAPTGDLLLVPQPAPTCRGFLPTRECFKRIVISSIADSPQENFDLTALGMGRGAPTRLCSNDTYRQTLAAGIGKV